MCRFVLSVAVLPLLGLVLARAADKKETEATCGNNGTAVHFLDSPKEAAQQAKLEEKLVFVLHVSGLFEDPNLT